MPTQRRFLQGLQRGQPAASGQQPFPQFPQRRIGLLLGFAVGDQVGFDPRQLLLTMFQVGGGRLFGRASFGQLHMQIGLGQLLPFEPQPLQALLVPRQLPLQVFDPGPLHFGLPQHFAMAPIEGFPGGLSLVQVGFGDGQRGGSIRLFGQQPGQFRFSGGECRRQFVLLLPIHPPLLIHLRQRRRDLVPFLLAPLTQFALVLQRLFESADFRAGLVVTALVIIERIVQLQTPGAADLQLGFQLALFGQQRFQRGFLLAQRVFAVTAIGLQVAPAQRQQFSAQATFFGAIVAILLGGPSLPLQMM